MLEVGLALAIAATLVVSISEPLTLVKGGGVAYVLNEAQPASGCPSAPVTVGVEGLRLY
jgi:hypothetical protein